MKKRYVVKLADTGDVIASGTSYECIKQMGIASVSSFHSLVSRCKAGKNMKYSIDSDDTMKGCEQK